MVVALDSNVFISFLTQDGPSVSAANQLIKSIISGKKIAVFSSIVYGEVIKVPSSPNQKQDIEAFFSNLEGAATDIPADKIICLLAAELRLQNTALKLPDSIHLATALHAHADMFVTADKQLARIAESFIKTRYLIDD